MTDAPAILRKDIARDELVAALRALRPAFAREGVVHMTLIGSRARGDNRPDSDVDLMIEVDPAGKFSALDLIGVKHVAEDSIGLPADVVMQRSLKPDFLARAMRDARKIF